MSKFETIGIGLSIVCMAGALFLLNRVDSPALLATAETVQQSAVVVVRDESELDAVTAQADALVAASDTSGRLASIVVDDVVIGGGAELTPGDTAVVHYIGRLQNGQEFDNSYNRGQPFSFTLGAGEVIEGWEQGLAGMRVGGERIVVIPPRFAYGAAGAGPIPGGATLIFAVELLAIE